MATLKGKNPSWTLRSSTLSEFGSEQLEAISLSALTGNVTYANRTETVIHLLNERYPGQVMPHLYCSSKQR